MSKEHPYTADQNTLLVGIDVGSTTTKAVALDSGTGTIQFSDYQRHGAAQTKSVIRILERIEAMFPGAALRLALSGSGGKPAAQCLRVPYIQEVVANALFLKRGYRQVRTAIELGGQDAKIIFFRENENGELDMADMRMNGSCAGGTGAFLDEIATLLKTPIEEFDALASCGTCVYDISGRCGVYAKTDIQPLLNQGVPKEDLALSALHAIAKQTIGGLAQGLEIQGPVAFEGGPLTFLPTLVRVFAQRLGLTPENIIIPEHPELAIAYGAALSLTGLFAENSEPVRIPELLTCLSEDSMPAEGNSASPFFLSQEEQAEFLQRHRMPEPPSSHIHPGDTIQAYLGIDSGSTTTKFVLLGENETILYSFYASNQGDPLSVAHKALLELRDRFHKAGARLELLGTGTTGYGELLFAKAFNADCHVVETVAHARAAEKYVQNATFILDIGGQDMKAIWLDGGIITNIVVNEACSSGCGSFLESFAATFGIPASEIAGIAFSSQHPAALGSRCTVFMNSSIVTEQRNGKQAADIMAGLCRSIIENVFTKVIRISNLDSLGDRVVVQGGTFQNDAVLRALEQYIGQEVTRAPYPGLMGAIGAALAAREQMERTGAQTSFPSLDALDNFSYTQQSNVPCPFCANHCKRMILAFSNGKTWVTNNRCERGEVLDEPGREAARSSVQENHPATPNLFRTRRELLFREYPCPAPSENRAEVIGLPRVLSYWDTMPFWSTFWRALGFQVRISSESTRRIYESGLSAVTSDTVCFPAKLVHGHIRTLAKQGVDRIFMPSITTVASENTASTSQSMCAVVKGYPIVIRNSDSPEQRWGIPFDAPLFHWYSDADRERQLTEYIERTFHIPPKQTVAAIQAGDSAMAQFRRELKEAGQSVLKLVEEQDGYAVVLASRPYQNDPLVNHELPEMFTRMGIPVLTADSLPGAEEVDLRRSRLDITNNYHARVLSTAILAALNPHLEYVQIVSFGCGHDAYLSDEVVRMMQEIGQKPPLILKLDESDIQGPLRIRVRSFLETIQMRRNRGTQAETRPLPEPYPVKYTKADKKEKVVLVPNTSHGFSRLMAAAFASQGVRAISLELGREEAIRMGKRYVHNDICFPAQIVIGEILAALRSGAYDECQVAVGMGKYIGDCRLTHYSALLRKALDDAGYVHVPILTNDDKDSHDLHPGFRLNLRSSLCIAFALPMLDILEELLRKIRPYECEPGSTQMAFDQGLDALMEGVERSGIAGAKEGFRQAIELMCRVAYDRSELRPQVLIVGEYLLNFHAGANHDIEQYLEDNGLEIIEARMSDVIQKTYFTLDTQIREYHLSKPVREKLWLRAADQVFDLAHNAADSIAKIHPLYERACRLPELVCDSDPVIHHTFDAGEGVLIPGEILHHAKRGCRSFVILQPFGCLPNHVVGRGIVRRLKELYPDAYILSLDYDPDVSFANTENRLQMLIMNAKTTQRTADCAGNSAVS